MLAEILKKFQSGEILSSSEIAAQLGTTEELVFMMSEELTRKGYLEEIFRCHQSCTSCQEKSGCGSRFTGRVWMLTQKGQ
ncbi:MAG: hypothetical protein AB9891_20510 [Anaerolineaceae bacterium]